MSEPTTWSLDELRAEIADLDETIFYILAEIDDRQAELDAQIGRSVDVYGLDETRWPGDTVHAVRTLRDAVAAAWHRLGGCREVVAEYRGVLIDRLYPDWTDCRNM